MKRSAFLTTSTGAVLAASRAGGAASGSQTPIAPNSAAVRYPATIATPDGLRVAISHRPKRIVALALDNAESAVELLLPDQLGRLVGISPLCWDPTISNIVPLAKRIGVSVPADAEFILGLKPDLVLAGILTNVDALTGVAGAGVPIVKIVDYHDLDDIFDDIRLTAWAIDERARGELLIAGMHRTIAAARARLRRDKVGMRILYLAPGFFTAGRATTFATKLQLCGVRNVAAEAGVVGGGPISAEAVVAMNPDGIIVRGGLQQDTGFLASLLANSQLDAVNAIRTKRVAEISAAAAMAVSTFFAPSLNAFVDAINKF
jgi:iron complex transport system substrate-binding protein